MRETRAASVFSWVKKRSGARCPEKTRVGLPESMMSRVSLAAPGWDGRIKNAADLEGARRSRPVSRPEFRVQYLREYMSVCASSAGCVDVTPSSVRRSYTRSDRGLICASPISTAPQKMLGSPLSPWPAPPKQPLVPHRLNGTSRASAVCRTNVYDVWNEKLYGLWGTSGQAWMLSPDT